MTKDVLVSISGLQFAEGVDNDSVEVITSGDYYKKNGKHYVVYDEVAEGTDELTKNIVKLGEDSLDITKRGVANVHIMFEKNRKNVTYYYTPFGSILLGIHATRIDVKETEEEITALVDYALEMNYEHVADCTVTIKITSKNAGDFRL